jgi:hypothetical protein
MSWQATSWALTKAPMPTNDPAARAVLGYLAVKADGHGRNAYPLALSVAHDCGLNPEVVPRVLKRLVDYGLISKDGVGPQGQPRWTLHMDLRHEDGSFEEFCRRYRASAAERKSRYRKTDVHDSRSGTVHDSKSGTSERVHDDESGTLPDVHDDESSCPGLSVGMSRTLSRNVHDSKSPQISPKETSLDQSLDQSMSELSLGIPTVSNAKPAAAANDDATFARFWPWYPRKDNRAQARKAWTKAAKRHGAEFLIAEAERWAGLWRAASTNRQFIPHGSTWLNNERWTDDPPAPRAVNGQHVPYRNPTDPNAYTGELA